MYLRNDDKIDESGLNGGGFGYDDAYNDFIVSTPQPALPIYDTPPPVIEVPQYVAPFVPPVETPIEQPVSVPQLPIILPIYTPYLPPIEYLTPLPVVNYAPVYDDAPPVLVPTATINNTMPQTLPEILNSSLIQTLGGQGLSIAPPDWIDLSIQDQDLADGLPVQNYSLPPIGVTSSRTYWWLIALAVIVFGYLISKNNK